MHENIYRIIIILMIIFSTTTCSRDVVPISQPEAGITSNSLLFYKYSIRIFSLHLIPIP